MIKMKSKLGYKKWKCYKKSGNSLLYLHVSEYMFYELNHSYTLWWRVFIIQTTGAIFTYYELEWWKGYEHGSGFEFGIYLPSQ